MIRIHKLRFVSAALASVVLVLASASHPAAAARDDGSPGPARATTQRAPAKSWLDNAHGHSRSYPTAGVRLRALPGRLPPLVWGGANYWFWSGVWYAPAAGSYVVVRPPYGIVVAELPPFRTAVVFGGLTYLYLNGVYYREQPGGSYEVVPSPVDSMGTTSGAPGRLYVYPARAQTAETQATDEYECHRWAASQSGFDPTPAATGQSTDVTHRADYVRARTACLEGRGYAVK